MKTFKIIACLSILMHVDFYSAFYTIKSSRELHLKQERFSYALLCFCPLDSLDDMNIKSGMKMLALDEELSHLHVVLLFVPVVHGLSDAIVDGYDYAGKPLFVLLHGKRIIGKKSFMHKADQMKRFIFSSLEQERLVEHDQEERFVKNTENSVASTPKDNFEEGYFADDEYEKNLTSAQEREAKIEAGYKPIDIVVKTQRYWWNRGYGNPYYGRNGLKYRDYFPKNIKE